MSRLSCIEKRSACNEVLNQLSIAINDTETFNGFTESTWDILRDHLIEDLLFLKRFNEYQKSINKGV